MLQGALANAIDQRGRPYQKLFAVSVRFEADRSADKDQLNLFDLVKCIDIPVGLNHPQSLVISGDDVHPGWTMSTFLERLLETIYACKGRSVMVG